MLRRGRALLILLVALAAVAGAALPLAALDVPFLAGRVNDQANLMSADVKQRTEQKLAAFEQKTGAQVVVLTLPSLEGEAVEDYTQRVAQAWKLGQKGKNNGVLFLVARDDRKMRIEVGYGLEPELTDLESGRILSDVVAPYFRNGDYGGGIEHGVDSILGSLEGQEVAPAPLVRGPADPNEMPVGSRVLFGLFIFGILGVFSMAALAGKGCQSWFLYLFLIPFYGIFPTILLPTLGIWAAGIWIVLFPILKLLLPALGVKFPASMSGGGGGPFFGGGWGGGGGGGSWGGGGGGGFSGGGGSFGGGGSSGSW